MRTGCEQKADEMGRKREDKKNIPEQDKIEKFNAFPAIDEGVN